MHKLYIFNKLRAVFTTLHCVRNLGMGLISSGLYYKHITIINYDSFVVNESGASLTDDARVVIYNRHMFIVQPTGVSVPTKP
jgi:hypothetical protein